MLPAIESMKLVAVQYTRGTVGLIAGVSAEEAAPLTPRSLKQYTNNYTGVSEHKAV